MSTLCQSRLLGLDTAKAALDKLAKDFGEQGVAGQLILERKLHRARLENFKSVDEYVSHVLAVRGELEDCGVNYADEKIGSMLLHGLPDTCTSLILAYGASHKKVTLESVLDFLHNYDERTNARESKTALAARTDHKSASVPTCYKCNKLGHKRPDCPDLKKEKRREERNRRLPMPVGVSKRILRRIILSIIMHRLGCSLLL